MPPDIKHKAISGGRPAETDLEYCCLTYKAKITNPTTCNNRTLTLPADLLHVFVPGLDFLVVPQLEGNKYVTDGYLNLYKNRFKCTLPKNFNPHTKSKKIKEPRKLSIH